MADRRPSSAYQIAATAFVHGKVAEILTEMADRVALFADRNARETILIGTYEEQLAKARDAVADLVAITPALDAVDAHAGSG